MRRRDEAAAAVNGKAEDIVGVLLEVRLRCACLSCTTRGFPRLPVIARLRVLVAVVPDDERRGGVHDEAIVGR